MHARVATRLAPAQAPRIVLVHGLGVSSRYMIPLAKRLAPFARVEAPDLPGFGLSDAPRATLDTAGLAGALEAWLAARGIEHATFVGNSYGCEIIARLG